MNTQSNHFQKAFKQIKIDENDIKFSRTIHALDPNGRVFFYKGGIFRGIYPHRAGFVRQLFTDGVVESLIKKGLIVNTQQTELDLQGFGLILKHEELDLVINSSAWSMASYLQAAINCLDLMIELHDNGLTLVDSHKGNVSLAPGGHTVWHDFGSIIELKRSHPAINQFLCCYYFPIQLYKRTRNAALIRRLGMYCSPKERNQLWHPLISEMIHSISNLPNGAKIEKAALKIIKATSSRPNNPKVLFKAIGNYISKQWNNHPDSYRLCHEYELLKYLRADLKKITIRENRAMLTVQPSQKTTHTDLAHLSKRSQAIITLIRENRASRVLDLCANNGLFPSLARYNCDVLIVAHTNEASASRHVNLTHRSQTDIRIFPIILDITRVTRTDAECLGVDTVLALDITHHLSLQQLYPFSFIAKQFAMTTRKRLITEFMPNGLENNVTTMQTRLPVDYTLSAFISALKSEFYQVKVVNYEQNPNTPPRILIVCDKQ